MMMMIPMILLLVDPPCLAWPRRRFCENYPFAPRCLGVAAKRSPSRTDIYKSLIDKVLAEELEDSLSRDPGLRNSERDTFEDKSETLSKLANMVISANHASRNTFMDSDDRWSDTYIDFETSSNV